MVFSVFVSYGVRLFMPSEATFGAMCMIFTRGSLGHSMISSGSFPASAILFYPTMLLKYMSKISYSLFSFLYTLQRVDLFEEVYSSDHWLIIQAEEWRGTIIK